jgi:oligopeptide transport system substrate-binding protein
MWLLITSIVAAACASGPQPPDVNAIDPDGELTTGMRMTPPQIDPQRSGSEQQIRHAAMVFEGLMTFDAKTLTPIPAAAKDQPKISDDGLTYTFTLRDGLQYSDGSPLTAKDFVYGFSRLCDPTVRSLRTPLLLIVVGCASFKEMDPRSTPPERLLAARNSLGFRANGEKEFVVSLIEPASYFTGIAATSLAYPVRESDVNKAGAAYGSEVATYIGNGPFRLVEWTVDERLVFERNERYRAPARLKRWTKVVVGDELAFAAYRNNEIDFYGGLPSGRAMSVNANRDVIQADAELRTQVVRVPGAFTDFYLLNVSRPPFTDKRVRQAFAKAIDRRAFVDDPALSVIPPGWPGHDADDTFQTFDAARAKELLQSSSFSGRTELSAVTITYRAADPQGRVLAEWPQQQLKRNLGVEVGIEAVDAVTLGQMNAIPRTAPQVIFNRWINFPDPQSWLTATFHSASGAFASVVGYKNADFDALVKDAGRERDPGRRLDLYRRASRILSEDAVAIWHWWGPNEYLRKPWVMGVADSGADVEYGIFRLNEIHVTKRR